MNPLFHLNLILLSNKTQGVLTMKKLFIVILLIFGLLIPAVSANEILYNETLDEFIDTTSKGLQTTTEVTDHYPWGKVEVNGIFFEDITLAKNVNYLIFEIPGDTGYWNDNHTYIENGEYHFNYQFNNKDCRGILYLNRKTNFLGFVTSTQFTIFLDAWGDWDIGNLTGNQFVRMPFSFIYDDVPVGTFTHETNAYLCWKNASDNQNPPIEDGNIKIAEVTWIDWKHHITVEEDIASYFININGIIDDAHYTSQVNFKKGGEVVSTFTNHGEDFQWTILKEEIDLLEIISPSGKVYRYPLEGDIPAGPDAIPINIRVQNSQTGALLADAHVKINASVNGTFYEVVNETLPAGTKTYYLQPTGGGLPNPDFYRLIATVEGYNAIMPYIDFEADIATTIYAYLNPIGGAPVDVNKTFIDFYVRDLNANPVAGATVKFGAYTLLTNSAGYTIFEVDKDKTYTWTVSKSGYGSVTGNAVIGSNDRYTINAVIAPAVTPTLTTPIPNSPTVGPTPTMTAPTGEPVSNLLEWFAAHFGMLLGGGVEVGKIFMWLFFTIPAGVFVGKEAKAGAAGFMAGAGIVTLFFVIIGWVPVWLVVILALIIGLLYAKAFSNIGNGGGR